MNDSEALAVVTNALARIAPDVTLDAVDADLEFQADLDLDSMDFLNLVTAVHRETGVDIPEPDYRKVTTPRAMARYVVDRSGVGV